MTKLFAQLKADSEEVLGTRLREVGVSAPFQEPPWQEDYYMRGVIEDALVDNGLLNYRGGTGRLFIGDAEAVMLSVRMNECWPYGCQGARSEGNAHHESNNKGIYFVR